jgi:hypothetical protein
MPTDKTALLQAFLGTLPEHTAMQLARAIEIDRLLDGSALPHDVILQGLRPLLRKIDATRRTPTPLRLFCRPFEDLMISGQRRERQRGRISRASVVPVWNWLNSALLPAQAKDYVEEIRSLALAHKPDEALTCAQKFWPVAGEALRAAVEADRKQACATLPNDHAVDDAGEMGLLLMAGSSMMAVQALMPKPTPAMTDDILHELRRIYEHVVVSVVDAAPYVPVVAMRRLEKPWEALKLALLVTRQTQDTLLSSTDMGLAGDVLFADMEDYRVGILAARHPSFDVDVLVDNLKGFTEISSAVVKEVEILRHGKWGQRLLKDRAAVGSAMDGFMERAPKEIAGALPSQRAGYTGGPRVPDFTRPVDPERIERALCYAKLLAGSRLYAVAGSFGAKHQDALEEARQTLRSYNEDLVKELRTAEGPRREIVERQFQLAAELTGLLFSEQEGELLRRRGKAASTPAAA